MTTENNEAKLIKFGTIEQNDNGTLCFSGFHIDAANEFNNDVVAILTLVIRRLQGELDKELAKPKPADVYPATPRQELK